MDKSFFCIAFRARYADVPERLVSIAMLDDVDMLDERRLWLACVRLWLKS